VKKGTTCHFQVGISGVPGLSQAQADAQAGSVTMSLIATFASPSNDIPANAKSESGSHWTATGTTVGATLEGSEATSNSVNSGSPRLSSVWWKWKAPAGGSIAVTSTAAPVTFERDGAYLSIFQQSFAGTYSQVSFNQAPTVTTPTIGITAGTTYYFQVGEVSKNDDGPVPLHLQATYTGPIISKLSRTSSTHNGGTTVTISGSRLTGTSLVYFGGIAVTSFTSVSSTKIVLKTPVHAKGLVAVFLYNGQFSAITSSIHYTFT
jgi:hypothetical protein